MNLLDKLKQKNKETLTPAVARAHNHNYMRCDNPKDLRPALTACTQEMDKTIANLKEGQKAVFNVGEDHKFISHTLLQTAIVSHLHHHYADRLLVTIEHPHNFIQPNQHPTAILNANISSYYSHTYLYDFLHSHKIATCFNDVAIKKENGYYYIDLSNPETKNFITTHTQIFSHINLNEGIKAEFPQGMFIRNAFMTQTAFHQAQQGGHDIILALTGAGHVFGNNDNDGDYLYSQSLCALQQNSTWTQEEITPQTRPFIPILGFKGYDATIIEKAQEFNGKVIFLENMDERIFFHVSKFSDFVKKNTSSKAQIALQDIWRNSGEQEGLGIPKPQLSSFYHQNALNALVPK